jgi:MerR family transcriptional regulator, mercuric resistance operon regulatory protein
MIANNACCSGYRSKSVHVSGEAQFTIGQLSRRAGIGIETIRYYERIGLMPRPPRTRGGRRAFGPDNLATLSFIKRCRELGFSLDDVRALLTLRASDRNCSDVKSIASRHLEAVRAKLRTLSEIEGNLTALIARCRGDAGPECPVLDALDATCCAETRVPASRLEQLPSDNDALRIQTARQPAFARHSASKTRVNALVASGEPKANVSAPGSARLPAAVRPARLEGNRGE